jgi:hypothetical protein
MITFLGREFLVRAVEKTRQFRSVKLPVERARVVVG